MGLTYFFHYTKGNSKGDFFFLDEGMGYDPVDVESHGII
jgi:hypothetical protein